MKASRFKMTYKNHDSEHSYKYEESFPADEYRIFGRWMFFLPKEKRKAMQALIDANVGDCFVWEDEEGVTEIIAE